MRLVGKMKKILIYTVNDGGFVDSLYHSLGDGFTAIGRDVVYCCINERNFIKNLESLINNEDIDFSIGHNEYGIIHAGQHDFLKNFYASKEHVAILDDAPYNMVTHKVFDAECPNLLLAYRDRSHREYLGSVRLKHPVLRYFFLPFGALLDKCDEAPAHKDIAVIFSGMYYGKATRSWHHPDNEKFVREFFDLAANVLEAEAVTVDEAVARVINDYALKMDRGVFYPGYKALYEYCKRYRRNRLVSMLADSGIQLTVCSDTWKNSTVADKLVYAPANTTKEVLHLYKRSKILLQDMAEFNDGSHCRVGDGALCKAMIVSESSKFLRENFEDSEIFFFEWKNLEDLPIQLSVLCKNEIVQNIYVNACCEKVNAKFLPKHSAATILDAISAARKNAGAVPLAGCGSS